VVAADLRALLRVASLQLKFPRRLGDLFQHELWIEPDAVLVLDDLARLAQELDRLGE
jgi:hypothetical protein